MEEQGEYLSDGDDGEVAYDPNNLIRRICEWNNARFPTDRNAEAGLRLLIGEVGDYANMRTPAKRIKSLADVVFIAAGQLHLECRQHGADALEVLRLVVEQNEIKPVAVDALGRVPKGKQQADLAAPYGPIDRAINAKKE